MSNRYDSGDVPWDHELPPPEVLALLPTLPPGRALDVGCGFGRASIFMAQQGWQVDGVDFVAQAVAVAQRRADAAGVPVMFHVGDITRLDFLDGPYDFVLDVGCSHALDDADLALYRDQLLRLLHPGAIVLLFARLRGEDSAESPRGVAEPVLLNIFSHGFDVVDIVHSVTEMPNGTWASAWYRFQRT
jgi:SAM-dependent methyltransferase